MSFFDKYIKAVRFLLPSPFTIAIVLTIFTLILGVLWPSPGTSSDISWTEKIKDFLKEWHKFEHIICDKKLFEWFFLINQNNPTLKNDKLRFILAHEKN